MGNDSEWALPGYAEIELLGSGGFGKVVLAKHQASGTLVAIKYLHAKFLTRPDVVAAFRQEAAMLRQVVSPYVARLFEFVEAPGGAALVMEAVPGVSLRAVLAADGQLMPESALAVLKGSLLGLGAAHAAGVVHRDYKPANVLVSGSGGSKLVDFGLAVLDGQGGLAAGSPSYMPPEQWAGAPATPATDVYAATCVFFQCVTGHRPYEAETSAELKTLHEYAPIPLERVPEPVRGIVARGMAKDVRQRPGSADAFVAELEAIARNGYGDDWEQRGWQRLAAQAAALVALTPLALLVTTGTAGAPLAAASGTAAAGVGSTASAGGVGSAAAGGVGATASAGAGATATVSAGATATVSGAAAAKVAAAVLTVVAVGVGGFFVARGWGDSPPAEPVAAPGCADERPAALAPGVDGADCRWQATADQAVGVDGQVVLSVPLSRPDSTHARFVVRSVDAATGKQRWQTPPVDALIDDPATAGADDAARSLRIVHWQGKRYAAFSYTTDRGWASTLMPLDGGKPVTWNGNAESMPTNRADDAVVAVDANSPPNVRVIDPASGTPTQLPVVAGNDVQAVGDGWFAEGTSQQPFVVKDFQGTTLWDSADHVPRSVNDPYVFRRVIAAHGEYTLALWASESSDGQADAVLSVHDKTGRIVAEGPFGYWGNDPGAVTVVASPNGRWLAVRTDLGGAAVDLQAAKVTKFDDPPKPLSVSDEGRVYGVVTGARDWVVIADGTNGQTAWTGKPETQLPLVAGEVAVVSNVPALVYDGSRKSGTVWALRREAGPAGKPPPPVIDEHFIGKWHSPEPVDQPNSDTTYRVRLSIREGRIDQEVGDVFYPGLECGGTLTLKSADKDKLVLQEDITEDPGNTCLKQVTLTLTRSGDGLGYAFDAQSGEQATAKLERR